MGWAETRVFDFRPGFQSPDWRGSGAVMPSTHSEFQNLSVRGVDGNKTARLSPPIVTRTANCSRMLILPC